MKNINNIKKKHSQKYSLGIDISNKGLYNVFNKKESGKI